MSANTGGRLGSGSVTITWRRYGFDGIETPAISPIWSA